FLVAPLAFDFVQSHYARLGDLDWEYLNRLFADLERQGTELLTASGVVPDEITHARSVDIRYIGQGHEVRVPVPGGSLGENDELPLQQSFDQVYRELYGRSGPAVGLEALTWRVVSSGPAPSIHQPTGDPSPSDRGALKGVRPAYFPECSEYRDTPVYDRYLLRPGDEMTGPAIIEERESTAVVGPGARIRVDSQLNLVVTPGGRDVGA
ncbi:MAG: hydantoinase/oxoprolinase family protein, partial [bacterium]|nr:hydantoinase/oxoprolinase family protein [bacterium]